MKNLAIRLPLTCVALAAVSLGLFARTPVATASAVPSPGRRTQTISGSVQSGTTPITSSNVTLYAAGSNYAAGAAVIGSASTNSSGAFTMGFSCPAGNPMVYITAVGGSAGLGANSAIGLMAVLQRCRTLSSGTSVTINELTTVGAEWTLVQFSDPTGQIIGAPMSNAAGIGNAARQADSDLVDPATGNPASFLPTAAQCGGSNAPVNCDGLERINTVANILAACVESSGPLSYECSMLMTNTGAPATATTLQAAHAMATNPTANVAMLFSLQVSPAKYGPTLPAAPADWTLALNFVPAGALFNFANLPALDSAGNVWVTNRDGGSGCATQSAPCGSVSELTAASGFATGFNFALAGAAFNTPIRPVLDTAGNVFVANFLGGTGCGSPLLISPQPPCGSVSELTVASGYSTGLNFAPSGAQFDIVDDLVLDKAGSVWAVDEEGGSGCAANQPPCGSVSELTSASGYTTGQNFAPTGAMFNTAFTLTVDSSSNVWVVNLTLPGTVSELTASSNYSTGLNFSPAGAGITQLQLLTVDNASNVWATNIIGGSGCGSGMSGLLAAVPPCGSVSELTAASGYSDGRNFVPAGAKIDWPVGIALDSAGNVWFANRSGGAGCGPSYALSQAPCGSISELIGADGYATGLNFSPPGAGFDRPTGAAVDGSGNVWTANLTGGAGCSVNPAASPCGSVSELIGIAKPVLTPTQACLQKGHNVCLP